MKPNTLPNDFSPADTINYYVLCELYDGLAIVDDEPSIRCVKVLSFTTVDGCHLPVTEHTGVNEALLSIENDRLTEYVLLSNINSFGITVGYEKMFVGQSSAEKAESLKLILFAMASFNGGDAE